MNQDETTRIGDRQRAQHHRVEDGEGGSRRADAEPEREHGNGGESRLAREGPPDVSHVLRELVEQAHAALIPVRLLHLIDPAERAARGGARVLRRQAAMHVVKGQQLEVGPDVVVQIGVAAKAAEHSLDARDEPAEERDHLFFQQPAHHGDGARPVVGLGGQLLSAARRDRVKARPPIRLAETPRARDPPFLLEPEQRWIDRPLIERERALGYLLDPPRDPVPVQWTKPLERLEHHEIERAVRDVAGLVHGFTC